jgi:hypothetical protein
MFSPILVLGEWNPPVNPDPTKILDEAESDARVGHYQDALAKQLWFHHHALEHEKSLSGVRLSAALMSWHDLGKKYPPAMKKLKETRDCAEARVLAGKDEDGMWHAFMDMDAINLELGEEPKTVATFIRLDKVSPATAKRVYDLAQPALVQAKEFHLCGKYVDPKESRSRMIMSHEVSLEIAKKTMDKRLQDFTERRFLRDASTLIAILVLNDRKNEADKIAEDAKRISNHPAKDEIIGSALKGKLRGELIAR